MLGDMSRTAAPGALMLVAVIIVALLSSGDSLRFELESGHTKCISEDIKSNAMTVGKYEVVNPHEGQPLADTHKISVRVTSSYGNSYHHADNVPSGQFAFTTGETGDYMACMWAPAHNPPLKITVEFDWRTGVAAKDWANVAKKNSIESMEFDLKHLHESVIAINEDMTYLRQREDEMQELNRSTNAKMGWLSLLSLVICLSVAGLQVWHLKNFFQKKKLI